MIKTILISITTLFILLFIAISYHPSLDNYSQYFINKENISSDYKATYLGASSILISDGKTTILTDGFITRPNIYSLLFTQIQPDKKLIQQTLKKLNIKKIDAIITLHSHHDHAMDSAEVAHQTKAYLIGSQSTANIAKSQDFYITKIITGKQNFQIGDFKLTTIPSKHTRMGKYIGNIVGLGEEISSEFKTPAYFTQFKESKTYALHIEHPKGNVFINASTNFVTNSLVNYKAHTLFLGIANLSQQPKSFQEEYFNQTALTLDARRVIPIHWDDFTKNINDKTQPMPRVFDDFKGSMDFIVQQTTLNDIDLKILRIFDTINLDK